jgi:hypothetical protein
MVRLARHIGKVVVAVVRDPSLLGAFLGFLGTVLTLCSVRIEADPIEVTHQDGRALHSALVKSSHPTFFRVGVILISLGFASQFVGRLRTVQRKEKGGR